MKSKEYHHLQEFILGWFHQDFDIVGDFIDPIVDEFKRVSRETEVRALAEHIREFLADFKGRVENEFGRHFEIDVDPTAFAPSIEAFLEQIAARLEAK